jgi:rare lipoprotein A (peptidoglycan hydrolase)
MLRPSATLAALTVAVATATVALPAAASSYGTTNGGASATPPPAEDTATAREAQNADYTIVKATWYGPGLYGNRMACGKRLTKRTVGVAHKRLPCGTKVALRYRGRTLVVPVVDRGPYARGISYDLTYATAKKLGMTATSRIAAAALND